MEDWEAVERLYNLKRSKYKSEDLTDDLDEVLFKEALNEVVFSQLTLNNGGRKIRG